MKLNLGILGGQTAGPDYIEKQRIANLVRQVEQDALNTIPRAGASGDLFMGHPLQDLVKHLPVEDQIKVRTAIRSKHGGLFAGVGMQAPPSTYSLQEKLEARMNWPKNSNQTYFDALVIHPAGDKVFVWVVTKDHQSTTLEDDTNLFPSDALITKLNLLK